MNGGEKIDLISICIPTRNRPNYLRHAIESCYVQSYRPLEILIGDDSDDKTQTFSIENLGTPLSVSIRVFKNNPPLGQAENINQLFDAANGSRLVLLHDDDWLLPNALDAMATTWNTTEGVAAVFGRQVVTTHEREILWDETERLNKQYNRTPEHAGPRQSTAASGLEGQFPNDGYLIDSALAKEVRFSPQVGAYTDLDFGVRYGFRARGRTYFLLDQYTAAYRLSPDSVSRSGQYPDKAHQMWETLFALEPPSEAAESYEQALRRLAVGALLSYALEYERLSAWRIYFSHRYEPRRLSLRGAYHALAILLPAVISLRQSARFRNH